jgi:hypothetical protein
MKSILLGCASALLLASTPALASGWSSTLTGDYTYLNAGGSDANAVGVNAMVAVPLNWNSLSLQANGSYHYLWGGSSSINAGSAGGALVWNGMNGRIALNGNYHTVSFLAATTYGAGGEWYVAPDWTVGLRGGGASVAGGASGGYVGGELIKYFNPNLALSGGVDYTGISALHTTDFSARLEYMPWQNLSVYGGYTFADVPGTGIHALTIGLRWYCDGDSPTLVDDQRSAPSSFISTYTATVLTF